MESPKIKVALFLTEPYARLLAVEAAKSDCFRSELVCRMLDTLPANKATKTVLSRNSKAEKIAAGKDITQ